MIRIFIRFYNHSTLLNNLIAKSWNSFAKIYVILCKLIFFWGQKNLKRRLIKMNCGMVLNIRVKIFLKSLGCWWIVLILGILDWTYLKKTNLYQKDLIFYQKMDKFNLNWLNKLINMIFGSKKTIRFRDQKVMFY